MGFFQPIGADPLLATTTTTDSSDGSTPLPKHVALLKKNFKLPGDARSHYGVAQDEAQALLAAGRSEELTDRVWTAYNDYKRDKDLVIVEGATMEGVANQLELNARFAAELGAPVLMVVDFHRDEHPTAAEVYNRALIARGQLLAEHADVLGVVLNKVPPGEHSILVQQVGRKLAAVGLPFAGGIPADALLGTARLNEVSRMQLFVCCSRLLFSYCSIE